MQRLLILWLALSLLAAPMLLSAQPQAMTPTDGAALSMMDDGCEDCDRADLDGSDCTRACVHAHCVMAHCAVFLPMPVAAVTPPQQRLKSRVFLASTYRSHLPALPVRPPIA